MSAPLLIARVRCLYHSCGGSEYEAEAADGRHVYVRYKSGFLGVWIDDDYNKAPCGERVAGVQWGDCQTCHSPAWAPGMCPSEAVGLAIGRRWRACCRGDLPYGDLVRLTPEIIWPARLTECDTDEAWLELCS